MVAAALLLSACQSDRLVGGSVPLWNVQTGRTAIVRPSLGSAPADFVSAWVPWWSGTAGRTAIENPGLSSTIGDVSPFWYGTANDGSITLLGTQGNLDSAVKAARDNSLMLIPTIADGTGAGVMSGILADPASRAAHIQNIVNLVLSKGYDGIDIDYEVFAFNHPGEPWTEITPKWVAFVNELSAALHAQGRLLSVTVPPIWNVTPATGGTLRAGYTVYAQDQIAAVVDRLRLMVYDWSVSSPGPIAPMTWVNSVIAYSNSVVPVSKLQLGVPAYGRHWVTQKNANETCPDAALYKQSVQMKNFGAVTAGHVVTRDASGELTSSWTQVVTGPRTKPLPPPVVPPATVTILSANNPADGPLLPAMRLTPPSTQVTCTVQHTVFVPDSYSIDQRADAAHAAGWRGIIVWAFGYENADLFDVLTV